MPNQQSSFIAQRFEQLKKDGRLALMPFLMAGDPDLSVTADVLLSLQRAGADMVELGMPYSDPLADGPVIQAAASRALAAGTCLLYTSPSPRDATLSRMPSSA